MLPPQQAGKLRIFDWPEPDPKVVSEEGLKEPVYTAGEAIRDVVTMATFTGNNPLRGCSKKTTTSGPWPVCMT